ncbi:MAG: recombinase family protein [Blautia sp.]|nr:recombinase family protein [Blautia sp.]
MQDFSLPSFDELISQAGSASGSAPSFDKSRSMNVIKPVVTAEKLKVAAYCRVSTEYEEQQSSIKIQRQHFSTLAAKHPDWEFVGIYADIVSGTKMEKRPELLRLLSDIDSGSVNLVLTKSVSRFARNITDLLEMVRSLTANGADIYFERERIDTRTMDSEFLLTILGSLAEDESHSIASNCRWGLQRRFQDGSYRAASAPYGYDLVDGNYSVNEREAAVVREIFDLAESGCGNQAIAKLLNERGIPTKRAGQVWKGKEVAGIWSGYHIHKILKNEAYIGDQVLQKTYSDSTFQRRINKGELPKFYLENHHPAIIEKKQFEAVRVIMDKRKTGPLGARIPSVFSGKMVCGCCGAKMQKMTNRVGNVSMVCGRRRKKAAHCGQTNLKEDWIKGAFESVVNTLAADDSDLREYREKIEGEFRGRNEERLRVIEARLPEIEKELTALSHSRNRNVVSGADFLNRQNELKKEELDLLTELERLTDNRINQTEELLKLVHSRGGSFVFDESTFNLVERVTARGEELIFRFRCGYEMSVEIERKK